MLRMLIHKLTAGSDKCLEQCRNSWEKFMIIGEKIHLLGVHSQTYSSNAIDGIADVLFRKPHALTDQKKDTVVMRQ